MISFIVVAEEALGTCLGLIAAVVIMHYADRLYRLYHNRDLGEDD